MAAPWFGDLDKDRYTVNGLCSERGFSLNVFDKGRPLGMLFTYPPDAFTPDSRKSLLKKLMSLFLPLLFFVTLVFACFSLDIFPDIFCFRDNVLGLLTFYFGVLWLSFRGAVILTASIIYHFDKEQCEWHALEHKCVVLIESELSITENNLRSISPALFRCGMGRVLFSLQLEIVLWMLLLVLLGVAHLDFFSTFLLLLIFWCAFLVIITDFLQTHKSVHKPRWLKDLLVILSFPGFILPFLYERFFILKSPSEEKIRAVTRELGQFLEEHNIVFS